MKGISPEHADLFRVSPDPHEALQRVDAALDFLWKDDKHTQHDKVAGDFDYEELLACLLWSQAALREQVDHLDPAGE